MQSDAFGSGGGASGPVFQCGFTALDAKTPYRPAQITAIPEIRGPQTAIVVGKAGEEIWTDKHGRVKVQFHWDRYGKSDENSSCWVRVYNGVNKPPYGLPGSAVISGLKSNSTKGGSGYNEYIMDDTKGQELIREHGQYDKDSTIEHDLREHVLHDRSRDVTNNETIKVGANKRETVAIAKALSIGAGYQISVGAGMNTSVALIQGEEVGLSKNVLVGKKFFIQAGDELEIVVGASALVMKKDGTITLKGKLIHATGADNVKIDGKVVDVN